MYVGCFLIFINPIPLISILYVRVRGISGCSSRLRSFFGEKVSRGKLVNEQGEANHPGVLSAP
jgi:hypothetical protein